MLIPYIGAASVRAASRSRTFRCPLPTVPASALRSAHSGSARNQRDSRGGSAVVRLQSKSWASWSQTMVPSVRTMKNVPGSRLCIQWRISRCTHGEAAAVGEAR